MRGWLFSQFFTFCLRIVAPFCSPRDLVLISIKNYRNLKKREHFKISKEKTSLGDGDGLTIAKNQLRKCKNESRKLYSLNSRGVSTNNSSNFIGADHFRIFKTGETLKNDIME